ncbi:MAG: glycosyltransferase [Elusimicrobia bacterium]|nr:glycosyltransferase [Elusimicrobiota bacterium]
MVVGSNPTAPMFLTPYAQERLLANRILFLYISAFSGHQRAADAIREALADCAPSIATHGVDSFTYAYPLIGRLVARAYIEILKHTPQIWEYLYDNPDVEAATRELRDLLNIMNSPKVERLLQQWKPSVLVCTQAVPASVIAAQKRRGKLSLPFIAIITDYAVHSYWLYPEVDLYLVASDEVKRDMVRRGIRPQRIAVTGIPISPRFLTVMPKKEARLRLHLDSDRPTVLLMGGSQGLGPMSETLSALRDDPLGIQCLVVTGLNRSLYRELRQRLGRDRRVRILGYSQSIPRFMDAADLIVTKPGGMTSSEAMAKGLPMIITNPIPGQEERNARYLLRQGVAERANSVEELVHLVQHLLQRPERLQRMANRAALVARPRAAYTAVDLILATVNAVPPHASPIPPSLTSGTLPHGH